MLRTLFLTLFVTGSVLQAQKPWNLEECIRYAIQHNISIQQGVINNEITANNTLQSKGQMLPTINVGAVHTYNFGKTIDRYTNTFANAQVLSQNFFIQGSLILWTGLSQYNNMRANEYNYMSSVERLKQMQNDLSLNVANAYISVIFANELYRISKNQYDITDEQLERTKKLVIAGSLAKSVEYDILAQRANEQVNVTTARNNYDLALLSLRQLMNLDSAGNFTIDRPIIEVTETSLLQDNVQQAYESGLNTQPIIKSGEYALLSTEKFLASARGRRSPVITLNAGLGTGTSGLAKDILGYNITGYQPSGFTSRFDTVYTPVTQLITRPTPFSEQFTNNVNKSVGITISIPILNGLQTHTSVKNAKLNAMNAKLSQDLNKQNLYKNIVQAYANAKAALDKYNASRQSVEAATESFKYAQQKFSAGAISGFDFNQAKNRLFAAESTALQAKYDYIFKLKVLDYYKGVPLGF